MIQDHRGLFCANYAHQCGGLKPCLGVWCPKCYKVDPMLEFLKQKAEDEGGALLEEEEEDIYNHARPGDQYMIEFQCDVWHFRNVKGRNPAMESWTNVSLLRYIRRANLDAFWRRASKTISGNLGVVNQHIKFGRCPPGVLSG